METVNTIELRDEDIFPEEEILKEVLGSSYSAYTQVLELFDDSDLSYQWQFYEEGRVWLCKVEKDNEIIVWMSAWTGFIKAALYFPVSIVDSVYDLDIDTSLKEKFKLTQNVDQSKPCIFEIRDTEILTDLEKVFKLKITGQ